MAKEGTRREVPVKPADELRQLDFQHLIKVLEYVPVALEKGDDRQAEINARHVAEQLAALIKPRPVHQKKFEVLEVTQTGGVYTTANAEDYHRQLQFTKRFLGGDEESMNRCKFTLQLRCNGCGFVFGTEREGPTGSTFSGNYELDTLGCPDCNAKSRAKRAAIRKAQVAELSAKPNPCARCGEQCPDYRGTYCSVKCRVAAHRQRKREEAAV